MRNDGYYVSTFTYDGKRYYAYSKESQRDADRKADKKLSELELNVVRYDSRMTVHEWSKAWLKDYKEQTTGAKWYKQMESLIDNQIEDAIGDMRLVDVKPIHINRLMNRYSDKSYSYQHKLLLVVRQIFDSAEENGIIDKSPVKRIKIAPRANTSRTRAITDEERALTLRTAEKYPADGLFFLIMLYCGCRPQEVSRLKMSDYDQDSKILHIERARKSDGSTGSTKSISGVRDVPVPEYLAERIERLGKKPNEYMVTALNGTPLTESSQRKLWLRFKRNMDIENGAKLFRNSIIESTLADDLTPYCYRHTYCTDLQDAGVPVTVAKVFMGHGDIRMTADIYTHHSDKNIIDAKNKLDRYQSSISDS